LASGNIAWIPIFWVDAVQIAGKKEEVKNRIGWRNIDAVKNNRIYDDVNPDLIFRPGPRIVHGIKALSQRIES
jgi:ABC-type Fe3+-hydroxamate transport system substrate-binding protein